MGVENSLSEYVWVAQPGEKRDDYWEPGKGLLAEPQKFLDSLFKFDKDNIPDAVIKSIQPYIDNEAFQPAAIAKVGLVQSSHWRQFEFILIFWMGEMDEGPSETRICKAPERLGKLTGEGAPSWSIPIVKAIIVTNDESLHGHCTNERRVRKRVKKERRDM